MCQLQLHGDVTDGVDVVDVGAHVLVDDNLAALAQLNTSLVQADTLGARCEADGDHNAVDGQSLLVAAILGLDLDLNRVTIVHDGGGLVSGHELDAQLLVFLGNNLGDVCVLVR